MGSTNNLQEYYDRGLPADRLMPASNSQQDAYWLLRSRIAAALAANWKEICDVSPAIARASAEFNDYLERNPTRTFRIFRPEDLDAAQESGSPLFLR